MTNDIEIKSALLERGYSYVGYEKPFQVWKREAREIGYCIPCGLMFVSINGERFRLRWTSRGINELISRIDEGVAVK